jgi:cytochrome b
MQADKPAVGPYGRRLRQLHLAIVICVCALALTGLIFHFRRKLGLGDFKIEIMLAHASIAYVFIAALIWRLALSIRGAEGDRLRHFIARPQDIRRLFSARADHKSRFKFAGRSPLSRLVASCLYFFIGANVATGMVFVSTDLYLPPFGPMVLSYVAADGERPSVEAVRAGKVDSKKMEQVRNFKRPFGKLHLAGAIVIASLALFHAIGVIATEWSAPNDKTARGRARLMLFGPRKSQ